MIDRRKVILGSMVTTSTLFASEAAACSVLATLKKPKRFKLRAAKREIRSLVDFANRAHGLTVREIAGWLGSRSINLNGVLDADHYDDWWQEEEFKVHRKEGLLKHWRISSGVVDEEPIRIVEVDPIKVRDNFGLVQFTLRRKLYREAYEPGGGDCGGLYKPAGFYNSERSYLAVIKNNKLDAVKHFPEWLYGAE